jgi:Mg2+ and Co2+ transporter CorA
MATRATQVLKASGLRSFCVADWLRRQFADAQDLIAESKESCIQTMRDTRQWRVAGRIVEAEQFWSQKPSAPAMAAFFRHAQAMDIRDLPDSLEMMERRVAALTAAVNQEIHVVIGSVQVEDARTMKRQTEWMVVLALLAAIYLPMTLVTGIFGMNISEINDDRSFPDRWSAVKAWGVVFSATVGCILFYAVVRRPVRWLLGLREVSRNKALDLEALKIE